MAFPNTSVSDIVATTIEYRNKKISDNVRKNNALLTRLQERGNEKTVSGGSVIFEELSFAENGNGGAYSGYDLLPVNAQDVISAAQFNIKQYAVPVVISGLEQLQNSGKEAMIDLMESRLAVAEATMANIISAGIYGDGTSYNGKAITGLDVAVPYTATSSQTTAYGGITPATGTITEFWRSYSVGQQAIPTGGTTGTMQGLMNTTWSNLVRGGDKPDLIIMDNNYWSIYLSTLQVIQRFTDPGEAKLGFPAVKYMTSDVVLDGGIGGYAYSNSTTGGAMYFLNTKYLKWRPHKDRNFVPLSPNRRYSVNQDAEVQILAWAGNLTCSGRKFQGRYQTA
jgi:hypothetical protein